MGAAVFPGVFLEAGNMNVIHFKVKVMEKS